MARQPFMDLEIPTKLLTFELPLYEGRGALSTK
jgi:hypothetical protein